MKKLFIIKLIAFILLTLLISCEEEILIADNHKENIIQGNVKLLNGRLHFEDEIAFNNYHESIKKHNEVEIENTMDSDFYSKGFYSLKPYISKKHPKNNLKDTLTNLMKYQ